MSAQYAMVSAVCEIDSSSTGLCPGATISWGNSVVEGPGIYHYIGTMSGDCQTLEVIDVQALIPPSLYWILEGDVLQAPGGWTDYTWSLNGTELSTTGPSIGVDGAGDYTVIATDPETGCTVGYTGTVGCPGDLDGDGLVGVTDILQLLVGFGCTTACGPSDVNADGVVNVSDVLFLLGLFGSNC